VAADSAPGADPLGPSPPGPLHTGPLLPGPLLPGPLLLGIDHVGLAVPDLDRAVTFHTEVLGLRLLHREENADQDIVEAMLGPASDPPGDTQIQLIAPRSAGSVIARFLERSGPGLHHVAYRVPDVEQAAALLRRRGLRLLYSRGKPGTRGSRINFVHPQDADGVLIELVGPAG
jgi:methylmalonyl-CoA/ethylmalonyl-CoA epimerase